MIFRKIVIFFTLFSNLIGFFDIISKLYLIIRFYQVFISELLFFDQNMPVFSKRVKKTDFVKSAKTFYFNTWQYFGTTPINSGIYATHAGANIWKKYLVLINPRANIFL